MSSQGVPLTYFENTPEIQNNTPIADFFTMLLTSVKAPHFESDRYGNNLRAIQYLKSIVKTRIITYKKIRVRPI